MSKKHKTSKPTPSSRTRRLQYKVRRRNLTWLWVTLGIAVIVLVVLGFLKPWQSSHLLSSDQAYQKYQEGALFLDVRSQAEWDQVHIDKSKLIPLDELQARLGELPKDQDIVVVCKTGVRSQEGMTILQKAGFSRVSSMIGGLTAWQAAGYPLEGSAP
jgi:rhodanese-related sulfurtransferase